MTAIAIVGANGRVGSEVSLLLDEYPGVDVIPVVRSDYAGSFLRRLGLDCRVGSVSRDADAPQLLDGAALVADFTLPGGLPSQVKMGIRANVRAITKHAPAGAAYVFISSTAAFGLDDNYQYQDYTIARTTYAVSKRYGERRARVLGVARRRPVSVLRLGEVHGDLQPASFDVKRALQTQSRTIGLPCRGDLPTDTVFASTIAATLVTLAAPNADHGAFSVLEQPQLSLGEVYRYYAEALGTPIELVDTGDPGRRPSMTAGLRRLIVGQRELLTAQVLPSYRPLELQLRGPHYVRSAASQIAQTAAADRYVPSHRHGAIPGPRVRLSPDITTAMAEAAVRLRYRLNARLGADAHVIPIG